MRMLQAGNGIIQAGVHSLHAQEGLISSGCQVVSSDGANWVQLEVPLMQYGCWKNSYVS